MKNPVKVSEINFSVICHATEDRDKVVKALTNIIPSKYRENLNIVERVLHGYYGNEIRMIKLTFKGKVAEEVFKYIISNLDDFSKGAILATIESRVDDKCSHIFIRLDKQMAYLGKPMLREGDDVIKVVTTFKYARKPEDIENYIKSI
ncbi:MAG TPA: hypothetical protein ENF75_03325 [Acidilobales archaeon]|nr:hypothetical protein [Acidilobales archaeon]